MTSQSSDGFFAHIIKLPPLQSRKIPVPFSEGDWIPIGYIPLGMYSYIHTQRIKRCPKSPRFFLQSYYYRGWDFSTSPILLFLGQQKHHHGIDLRIRHYIPRPSKDIKFQSPGLILVVGTNFTSLEDSGIFIYVLHISIYPIYNYSHSIPSPSQISITKSLQSSCATGTKSSSEAERIGRIGKVAEWGLLKRIVGSPKTILPETNIFPENWWLGD